MPTILPEELIVDRKARMRIPFFQQAARPPQDRIRDFDATFIPLTPEQARQAAERCIHCPDPAPCYKACPVHNDIPSAMWMIEQGDFLGAAALYRQTSSLPEVCGLIDFRLRRSKEKGNQFRHQTTIKWQDAFRQIPEVAK